MTDLYPYKFNVSKLEYGAVADYLASIPTHSYIIAKRAMVEELTLEDWRNIRETIAVEEANTAGDDHQVTDEAERQALLATDSDSTVMISLLGHPTTTTRRMLNRVAIQVGVNNAGINREDLVAAVERGVESYLVQFKSRDDAIMFKLAMWKRPDGGGA